MLPVDSNPVCADPIYLPLVDAAFDGRGAAAPRAIEELRTRACVRCPVRDACLIEGMSSGEHGPYGGVSREARVALGAPTTYTANLAGIDRGWMEPPEDDQRGRSPRA